MDKYNDPGSQGILSWLAKWYAFQQKQEEMFITRAHAEELALRAEMDGEVIKATGEVVAKETV